LLYPIGFCDCKGNAKFLFCKLFLEIS